MKKILLILMLGIFLISLTSAQDEQSWGYVKAGDCISLTQTCANCSFVNITGITYPNKTDSGLSESILMQKTGTFYNHSFCDTTSFGEYIVSGDHNLDGEIGIWNANFESNTLGREFTGADSIIYVFLSIAVFLMFAIALYFQIKLPSKNVSDDDGVILKVSRVKYLKFMLILVTYPLFLWFLNILVAMSTNFSALSLFFGFFSFLFDILLRLSLPLFIFVFVVIIFNVIKDNHIHDMVKRFGKYKK